MVVRKLSTTRSILLFEGADKAAYWRRFAMLLTLSVVIATMGLLRNSGAVVIAAMLVAPLMTPILGVAAAMVMGWLKRAVTLALTVCLAAIVCVMMAWFLVYVADVPRGILIPDQVLARTDPGTEDLIVALAAGVAGAYVQINKSELSLLPGAAIGVSLVPPLSASGILLYFDEPAEAYEAGLLFATNLGAIILSACAVYLVYAARSVVFSKGKRKLNFTASVFVAIAFLVVVVLQLGKSTYNRYLETRTEAQLADAIRAWADPVSVEIIRIDVNAQRKRAEVWLVVDLPAEAQFKVSSIAGLLPPKLRETPLVGVLEEELGPGYLAIIRYQPRIGAQIILGTENVQQAPDVTEITEDE
ncbi:DUF389 domain-containing protein [Ruegeria sp. HKCCD6228]|uniref:DUF389 domain-containing protein n=1 Tax=unclassified Ruegeria TaxID=2625375 RepID=UPI0014881D3D|nr:MULTISPECIES: DUF389 domain-containing protein [unclassified Ruegeria]NOC83667.1 DUF389 domain-containing protein [Ruegeria sp. HKCCD6428]NOD97106.1 DUF389 domain-containing protein [Ruegeria sp. HKCCD6228]